MDWSGVETAIPSTYQAFFTGSSGQGRLFHNLSGSKNTLVVPPGEGAIYVYNEALSISFVGSKARISQAGSGIASLPGLLYTYSGEVFTERDREVEKTAFMNRQTGELKLTFALKPATLTGKVKSINAVITGVASEIDMLTNRLSVPSTLSTTCAINSYYAVATARLLGFTQTSAPTLTLYVEFENGASASVKQDLTAWAQPFNESKNRLFTLNASLNLSDTNVSSITLDNWEVNTESRYLSAFPATVNFSANAFSESESVTVITDRPSWQYSVEQVGNWLQVAKYDDRLELSASGNTSETLRQAYIHISTAGLNETVTVTQNAIQSTSYSDKETIKLQSATIGKGVNLVLMGDGYTVKDMVRGTGKYENDMRLTTEHFFSIYPYSRYREYFNVYMIVAVSSQEGISNNSTGEMVDTKFETLWEGSPSTEISCNEYVVLDYVRSITELSGVSRDALTVIMPINSPVYAGTCYMYRDGYSVSMCPVGSVFEKLIHHEAGGHGFGKLLDEYIYNPKDHIPNDYKEIIIELKGQGWYENVDFYGDITQTSWKGFASNPKYSMVGAFEGAYMYGKGIWRPEYNSCMNNNISYFNAPSRWAQVRRIMQLAGISYSFAQFLIDDIVPDYPVTTRHYEDKDFIPFALPVFKE
jgi:hypothetical protein